MGSIPRHIPVSSRLFSYTLRHEFDSANRICLGQLHKESNGLHLRWCSALVRVCGEQMFGAALPDLPGSGPGAGCLRQFKPGLAGRPADDLFA